MDNHTLNKAKDYLKEEEDIINEILFDVQFNKPNNVFDIFLKEKFKDNKQLNSDQLDNVDKYRILWNNLSPKDKEKYQVLYEKENFKYLRDKEIIRKFIFKGIDGKIKIKSTSYKT